MAVKGSRVPQRAASAGHDDERVLVAGCVRGEEQALRCFFRTYRPTVQRVLHYTVAQTGELDDLVQETFVQAFRSLPRFRGESRVSTWLYRITVRVALQHLRRASSRSNADISLDDPDSRLSLADPGRSPEQDLLGREQTRRVRAVLDHIAPAKRVVLVMRDLEGLSGEEVARILDIPAATVRTRLYHARRELHDLAAADPLLGGEGRGA